MKREIDLIVFDFDGTIVNSKEDIAASANYVLSQRGLPSKDPELIGTYIGDGIHVLMGKTLEIDDEEDIAEAVKIFRGHYWDHCMDKTRVYPGVREALDRLSAKPKAIVTNKPKRFADKILEGFSLSGYFVDVVGGDGPYAKKPSPEGIMAVVSSLGFAAGKTLVVGDSPNDIIAGTGAGCVTCAVAYGFTVRSILEAGSPDFIVDSMVEVPGLIE